MYNAPTPIFFFRDLSGTKINHIPHDGLENLSDLKLEGTPNLWEISDGIVGIPALRKVKVAKNQRWLCCAFEMKRSMMHAPLSMIKSNGTQLCSSPKPSRGTLRNTRSPIKTFSSTTEETRTDGVMITTVNPFGGFGRKRKRKRRRRSFGFGTFLSDNSSTIWSKPTEKSR